MSPVRETDMNEPRPPKMTSGDALILGCAVVGILMGLSLLSYQAAVGVGVLALLFVVWKLLTTKP